VSDQVTAPGADEIVWARSKATGRMKQMSRAKLAILAHGWEAADAPSENDEVVAPMSAATTEEHPERTPDAPATSRARRGAALSEES
jgi:hypothetical protein